MRISEIYASIQGETAFAGLPCALVRTTGCDLRCHYCDTPHAFTGGREMAPHEVVEAVRGLGPRLVLLTGGEPMLQRELPGLAELLLDEGFDVMIETSGAHALDALPPGVVRIVDVKTPGSGEGHRVRWDVIEALRPRDAAKFVLSHEADYRWAADVVRARGLGQRTQVLMSPVHGALDARDLVAWMLRDRLPARLNLQLHKYIWGADATGV